MRSIFLPFLLMLAFVAYGQQKEKVAIINTVDDGNPPISNSELSYLTKKLRGIAVNTLPQKNYDIMTDDHIIDILGSQEDAEKKCEEAGGCLAKFGREIKVHYIAQARIGRFGKDLTIAAELYDTRSSKLIGSLEGEAKDVYGLMSVLEAKAPDLFKKMLGTKASPLIPNGIGGVQIAESYEYENDRKRYFASITSDPEGASLSFNGLPDAKCTKTPCNVELYEGNVRIIANLEQYEIADTTVSIKQKQNINIKLKPNFGVLEVRSAYLEGIGYDKPWSLTINDKFYSLGEIRLSPNKYAVKLRHECYENIDFEVGINKGSHEVFDMANHIALKKGGLDLSAEADGVPASEPIFVNGKRVGETPFSGSIPVCAKIEIGKNRETVNVRIEHKTTKEYKHQMSTEEMKRRARVAEEELARKRELRMREIEQRREEEEYRTKLLEKERIQEEEKQEELAFMKSPRITIGGGRSWLMEYINPLYRNNGGFFYTDIEILNFASGRLRLGVDFDYGITRINIYDIHNDYAKVHWWRGGALARLYVFESLWGPYLTAGASWYKDWNEFIGVDIEPYSGPSFSVGAGLWFFLFIETQYFMMPTDGRMAGYLALRCGISFPMALIKDIIKNANKEKP